jgi:hypothetical protein
VDGDLQLGLAGQRAAAGERAVDHDALSLADREHVQGEGPWLVAVALERGREADIFDRSHAPARYREERRLGERLDPHHVREHRSPIGPGP